MTDINLGTVPNDKTGSSARVAGAIINANFKYLNDKLNNVDQIITQTGYSLAGQVLTMNAGWVWNILGVAYTNPVAVTNTIPFAAAGKQRLDMFILNQSNTYSRLIGIEGVIPVSPIKLDNTIEAFLVLVGDSTIGQPSSSSSAETTTSILTKIGDGTTISQAYLPSYVDDILEFSNLAAFPATGEIGKIYIALSPSSKQYRWSGSTYVQITNGLIASTSDVPEDSGFLYYTATRVLNWIRDNLFSSMSAKTTLVDADKLALGDSADSEKTKTITWLNFKGLFKTVGGVSIFGSGDLTVSGTSYVSYTFIRYFSLNAQTWYVAQDPYAHIMTSSGTTSLTTALSGVVTGNNLCVAPFDMKLVNISVAMRNASSRIIGVVAGTPSIEHTISSVVSIYQQSSYSDASAQSIDFDDTSTTITKGQLVRISVMHNTTGFANSRDTFTFTFKKV